MSNIVVNIESQALKAKILTAVQNAVDAVLSEIQKPTSATETTNTQKPGGSFKLPSAE